MNKLDIHTKCIELLDEKIVQSERMMQAARDSANSDTKSSAGDKFETGREMAMQEVNKAHTQNQQALAMKNALLKLNLSQSSDTVQVGSLVQTNKGLFYISVSLGIVDVNSDNCFVISGNSPIGSKLIGLEIGGEIGFNGNSYLIKEIS